MNNIFNGSIVAALIALSTVACGSSAPKITVRYLPRITTTSSAEIFAQEKDHQVRLVEEACDGDTGTDTWVPAGHEEVTPSTKDNAYAWLIANSSQGSDANHPTLLIREHCSSTTNIAQSGTIKLLDESKLVRTADLEKR